MVETVLTPAGGLRGRLDGHAMAVPLATTGAHDQVHRVRLPGACHVESVDPAPWRLFRTPTETHVVWRAAADSRRRFAPGRILFRLDGMLTTNWPSERRVAGAAMEFLEALEARDGEALRRIVHPAYEQDPGGFGRDELMRPDAIPATRHDDVRLLDVTAVGPTVTLDLLADWSLPGRSGGQVVLRRMPLRIAMLRTDRGPRVLRFAPRTSVDRGELEDGAYRHVELDVEMRPPRDAIVHRMMDGLTAMQILLSCPEDPDRHVEVLGHFATEDEEEAAIRMRLSKCDSALGVVGAANARSAPGSPAPEWTWQGREGRWTHERWQFITRGRRHFLIRTAARGPDREQAVRHHHDARSWFGAVMQTLRID